MITTSAEFLRCALNNYNNPHLCFIEEFESDLKRFTYINMLINKYKEVQENLNPRLIINHIIILENCFSLPILLKLFEYKISDENKQILDTFLFSLGRISESKYGLDFTLLNTLNEL